MTAVCSMGEVYRFAVRAAVGILLLMQAGCVSQQFRRENTADRIASRQEGRHASLSYVQFLNYCLYPARGILGGMWILEGPENRAWNVDADGNVPDGSFFVNRDIAGMSPEDLANPWNTAPPQMPLTVAKPKTGATSGFIGKDASGRTFNVKLDDPDWPQLGTSAEAIGSRLAWAMGYHVPPVHVVTIEGTGDPRYDGKRAAAVEFVPGEVVGQWRFEHVKYRREMRAAKVLAMWINEIDHGDNNTLLAWDGRKMVYWWIDFNSSLGSWQGQPKEPQMGWVQAWDPPWQARMILTLGLVRPGCDPSQPIVSPAVGRFDGRLDPRAWRSHQENPAYNQLTDADARWMAAKMAALSEQHLRAIVHAGRYSDPADEEYVFQTLLARRAAILEAFGR